MLLSPSSCWQYFSEGACNFLFAIPSGPEVLRVSKPDHGVCPLSRVLCQCVLGPLVPSVRPVLVSAGWLASLVVRAQEQGRREVGRCRDKLDQWIGKNELLVDGELMENLARVMMAEIKPKCGVLALSPFLGTVGEMNCDWTVKMRECRFSMHQLVKHNDDKNRSKYCPVDLFSLEDNRMKYAWDAFLKHPQNNLRFFGEVSDLTRSICSKVLQSDLVKSTLRKIMLVQALDCWDIQLLRFFPMPLEFTEIVC